jgi:hypothetical protein
VDPQAALAHLGLVQLAVLALAAHRVTRLLVEDTILDRPRSWVAFHSHPKVDELLSCPWCTGFWVSLAWAGAFLLWPLGTLAAALPWALSSAVGLLAARELQGEVQAFGEADEPRG